jgi:hypothetical protein
MDVIASGCSADSLGRSQILKSDYATDATSKGGAKLYETMFWAERRDIYGGMYVFLHGDGLLVHCGYAEEPGCEKSYHGMYSFLHLISFQLNWGSLVAAFVFTRRFAAEWYAQTWMRYKKQLFWSKHLDMLPIDIYFGDCIFVTFDVAIFTSISTTFKEDFWTGRTRLKPFWERLTCFEDCELFCKGWR